MKKKLIVLIFNLYFGLEFNKSRKTLTYLIFFTVKVGSTGIKSEEND